MNRFSVYINEGAFFHEPHLEDIDSKKSYRYDLVPRDVMRAFATYIRNRGKISPKEADLMLLFLQFGKS